jgi:hypothetical protein
VALLLSPSGLLFLSLKLTVKTFKIPHFSHSASVNLLRAPYIALLATELNAEFGKRMLFFVRQCSSCLSTVLVALHVARSSLQALIVAS